MRELRFRILRESAALVLLIFLLLAADALCYQVTLPVEIDVQGKAATLHVGSETLSLGSIDKPVAFQLAPHDPLVHEYQIDGTDSTNNHTLDLAYLNSIVTSPYYYLQAQMRDLDGTSRWRDLRVEADNHIVAQAAWPANGAQVALPPAASVRLNVLLQRPETPMTLSLTTADDTILHITLDRNDRQILVIRDVPGLGDKPPLTSKFFPVDPLPFAMMVIDSLIRILLWAGIMLCLVLLLEVKIALVRALWSHFVRRPKRTVPLATQTLSSTAIIWHAAELHTIDLRLPTVTGYNCLRKCWQRLSSAIHPFGLIALGGSLFFVSWIATVQYHAQPHNYDASAYLFATKMYATGHLSVPVPPAIDRFPGPFMVQYHGQWFGQYSPGTALTLVPGLWLGIPWLIEPLLGTLALLGIGLVAARLYDRRVATLAIILGALSPFYSYLAASYLSHAIGLFYLVWGLWTLLRFAQGEARWNLLFSATLFGMAVLTRDLVAVLFVAIALPGVLLLSWRRLRQDWRRWPVPGAISIFVALIFVDLSLGFNAILTGSPKVTPRSLFFQDDHWGFGPGVGFYGQHTLAAGFVNLDELLTILQIDLFGWPFYFTLAFLAIPFLTRRARGADWFLLVSAILLTGAYIGYFYHGIYLGPRYLFETLPFLLILTARGILKLAATGIAAGRTITVWLRRDFTLGITSPQPRVSTATIVLVSVLVACNLLYFTPRQIVLHQDYTGLPAGTHLDLSTIYHPPVHNAIVVTDDGKVYQSVLFPLNDPLLRGDVIYAWIDNSAEYAELHTAFPGRTLYYLDIAPDGLVQYVALP